VEAYHREVAKWLTAGQAPVKKDTVTTIGELVILYLDWREENCDSPQLDFYGDATRLLVSLYGLQPTDKFGSADLFTLQQALIFSRKDKTKPLCWTTVNKYVKAIKNMFEWGVTEDQIDEVIEHTLSHCPSWHPTPNLNDTRQIQR